MKASSVMAQRWLEAAGVPSSGSLKFFFPVRIHVNAIGRALHRIIGADHGGFIRFGRIHGTPRPCCFGIKHLILGKFAIGLIL